MRQRQRGQAFITFIGSSPLVEKMNVFFKNVIPAEAGMTKRSKDKSSIIVSYIILLNNWEMNLFIIYFLGTWIKKFY
jgi:hypothetical protein